jgi:hypothetical protein
MLLLHIHNNNILSSIFYSMNKNVMLIGADIRFAGRSDVAVGMVAFDGRRVWAVNDGRLLVGLSGATWAGLRPRSHSLRSHSSHFVVVSSIYPSSLRTVADKIPLLHKPFSVVFVSGITGLRPQFRPRFRLALLCGILKAEWVSVLIVPSEGEGSSLGILKQLFRS